MDGHLRARPQERKQERRKMKRRTAPGLAAAHRIPAAANEEFTAMANALDWVARVHLSWDPYEVWRTRVKESSSVMPDSVMPDSVMPDSVMPERERDASHWTLGREAPAAAVP
jgi:hypothetical protein